MLYAEISFSLCLPIIPLELPQSFPHNYFSTTSAIQTFVENSPRSCNANFAVPPYKSYVNVVSLHFSQSKAHMVFYNPNNNLVKLRAPLNTTLSQTIY